MHSHKSLGNHLHIKPDAVLPIPGPADRELLVAVKCVRMTQEMIHFAAVTAEQALKQSCTRKDVAAFVKKRFDEKYGPLWHCIVGRDFGRLVLRPVSYQLGVQYLILFHFANYKFHLHSSLFFSKVRSSEIMAVKFFTIR